MMALALVGAAVASMADFNLAAFVATDGRSPLAQALDDPIRTRSRYLPPKIEEEEDAADNGVRIKLRWKRVKLYVPLGPG